MAYNRENNIDDLIALTAAATTSAQDDQTDQTYYLVLEEFDGRGAFSNPPYAYGLSQVVHIFREDELTTKTVADLLKQYPVSEEIDTCLTLRRKLEKMIHYLPYKASH